MGGKWSMFWSFKYLMDASGTDEAKRWSFRLETMVGSGKERSWIRDVCVDNHELVGYKENK